MTVIKQERSRGVHMNTIWNQVIPLWNAGKISDDQRDALRLLLSAIRIDQEGRASIADMTIMEPEGTSIE